MTDLFEPELKYARIPVDKKARRQTELEAKRTQAQRLQDAGARVILQKLLVVPYATATKSHPVHTGSISFR